MRIRQESSTLAEILSLLPAPKHFKVISLELLHYQTFFET